MEIGEFMLFCRDFKIPLKKAHLMEIFKKCSDYRKNVVNFQQFESLVEVLGKELVSNRATEINERLREIEKIVKGEDQADKEKKKKHRKKKKVESSTNVSKNEEVKGSETEGDKTEGEKTEGDKTKGEKPEHIKTEEEVKIEQEKAA